MINYNDNKGNVSELNVTDHSSAQSRQGQNSDCQTKAYLDQPVAIGTNGTSFFYKPVSKDLIGQYQYMNTCDNKYIIGKCIINHILCTYYYLRNKINYRYKLL